MKKFCSIITLILLTMSNSAWSRGAATDINNEWVLEAVDKEADVAVYYRTLKSGNIEFRGVTKISASLNSLVSLLHDVESMPEWVYNVERASVLEKVSDVEGYSYVLNRAHFPFSKRDSVIHTMISQDPITLAVTIDGQSAADFIPASPDYVRLTLVKSFWQFNPIKNGTVEVVFQGMGEPGGNIVADISHSSVFQWISKRLLWELPMVSLKNMKQQIQKDKYRNKQYEFIKEPTQ